MVRQAAAAASWPTRTVSPAEQCFQEGRRHFGISQHFAPESNMGCVVANSTGEILAAATNVFGNEHSPELCEHAA